MRKTLLIIILASFLFEIKGQDLTIEKTDTEWSEGTIKLSDGTTLAGLLLYNDKTGILRFESGETSKSLTARSVTSYQYHDAVIGKTRSFYAIEYEDSKTGAKRPLFFELVREYSEFAVLSKIDPVDVGQIQSPYGNTFPNSTTTQTQVSQSETIYFLKPGSDITPVLRITNKEIDSSFGIGLLVMVPYKTKSTKRKVEGKDVLESYTEPYYDDLKKYAKENNLTFKEKEDFFKILDYYETLITK